jgi:GNAT superfamily N-acetyltransferase
MTRPALVRPIVAADWPAINRIQHACFPPSAVESPAVLQSLWHHAPDTCLVAETREPIGYLLAHPWTVDTLPPLHAVLDELPDPAPCLFVHDLAVTPSERGGGRAVQLVDAVLTRARQQGLRFGSLLAVQGSERFWARFGFVTDPDRTATFAPRVHALYGLDFSFMTARWVAV